MAMALRPRARASVITSRYGSQALALGARPGRDGGPGSVDTVPVMAGFDGPESVDSSVGMAGFDGPESVDTSSVMAGFGTPSPGRPRPRTAMPAARR